MSKPLSITVVTKQNGYDLIINKRQYFYFNIETLIQGIAYHAVDDFKEPAELEDMAGMINSHIAMLKQVRKDTDKLLDTIATRDTEILALRDKIHELKAKKKSEASKE